MLRHCDLYAGIGGFTQAAIALGRVLYLSRLSNSVNEF